MLATLVVLCIIFINPKLGTYLIWLILFTYPQGWWFEHSYLPLNIGVDDLFCLTLFVMVLVRRNLFGRIPIRFGYAFWTILAFVFVAVIANIVGSRDAPSAERIFYVKDIMKLGVYFALFYAILHCIDDVRDLKIQLTMFSFAAVAGAVIVILHYFYPIRMEAWANPGDIERMGIVYEGRATGAFLNANAAACVLGCSLMLVITSIRLQKTLISKTITYTFIFVLLAGVLVTKSRAGLIAIAGVLVLMAFVGRGKKFAWLVIIAAIIIGGFFSGVKQLYEERLVGIYDPVTGVWTENVAVRFELWSSYLKTATAKDYLLGQGFRQGMVRNGAESHSAYISLITVYGIGGVLWAFIALVLFLKRSIMLRHSSNPLIKVIAEGCIWAFLAWGIYAITADAISDHYGRYLLFYLVVILDRATFLFRQEQLQQLASEESFTETWNPQIQESY
jgi:hypothetical protein